MNFTEALDALAAGSHIRRPGWAFNVYLQPLSVPVLSSTGWVLTKSPVVQDPLHNPSQPVDRSPYAFSDDEISATDWEITT